MHLKVSTALAAAALAAAVIVPISAEATTSAPTPIFFQWRPGTPLPAATNGWRLMAEPTSKVLAAMKPGQKMPLVTPSKATPNSAGIVNLIETPTYCVSVLDRQLGKWATFVGATYATVNHITGHFSYGEGSSSSLGIGTSGSGDQGSFSESYTISVSTSFTQKMPKTYTRGKNWWQTFFSYAEYELVCTVVGDSYYVQATKWDAGDGVEHPKHFPKVTGGNCVPELAGSGIEDDKHRAATFGVGFDIGKPIGFKGSADTGWTKDAKITYDWHVNGSACGTDNTPPQAAAIVAR
jgi:hypothetical protein